MPGAHALLSPSAASRWMKCTRSARAESLEPETSNDAADEGTLAHALAEIRLKKWRGLITKAQYLAAFETIADSPFYNAEMWDYVTEYVNFIKGQFYDAQDEGHADIYLETRVSIEKYAKESFGTIDVRIASPHTLYITDLKYGKGVAVSAEENPQIMLYALGALNAPDTKKHTINRVVMTIHQPRLESVTTFTMSVYDLFEWAHQVLIPAADLAYRGAGGFVAGSHCMFCKIKSRCKALAEHNLILASMEFAAANLLTDSEIAKVLSVAAAFKSWIKEVEEYARQEAIKGKQWPGFKLVTGRANRILRDETKLVKTLKAAGYAESEIFHTPTLKGLGDLTKLLGKQDFKKLVEPLLIKPEGAPTLVPEDDKRAAKGSTEDARNVFSLLT